MPTFTLDQFTDKVGHTFRIETEQGTVDATLEEAVASGKEFRGVQPYSLLFKVPEGVVEQQQIYHLEHDEIGGMDFFLVPLGPGEDGDQRCEAVFT